MRLFDCFCGAGQHLASRTSFSRRQALQATGVGFLVSLAALLGDAGQTAKALPAVSGAPAVDRLSVQIVTDNYTDRYSIPQHFEGMMVERAGGTEKPGVPPRSTLEAEWGLAMVAESVSGAATRRLMVDFGYSPEVLLNNMRFLGVDPAMLDGLVLSHGHADHFGGLLGLLTAAKGKLKPGLPLFVGGEDCFCARHGSNDSDFGVLDRPAILATGIRLMLAEGPAIAADHAVTSGQIPKA